MIKQNLKNYQKMLLLNENLNRNFSWEHWKIIYVWTMQNMKKFIQVILLLLKHMGHLTCIKLLTLILTFVLVFLPVVITITMFPNVFMNSFFLIYRMNFAKKDTFTFGEVLKEVSINDKFLVFYDINSLFTNISLKKTIKLAVDLIKTSYPNFKIWSDNLTKLLKFATCETHFFIQWEILRSDRRCSYGISSSTSFSQSFMGHNKKL